ncbi:MAG: NAD(P)/FAD-dependent oxidoreductase [Myxococcales bacterium]|nr:NAD(P)/FAD-dependent oxidoreductase [Myxococcales bacterium]
MMEQWDIVIVGGGAAGLLAAGAASRAGAKVLVLEKMHQVGRKLGIAGKGRGNLTNDKPVELFVEGYRSGGEFLRGAFSRFFSRDLIELLEKRQVPCVVERGGRVFPQSGKALDVVNALYRYARGEGGAVRTETEVRAIDALEKGFLLQLAGGRIQANRLILATGGKSYPRTGSTGDGFRFASRLGHKLTPPRPALVPLSIDNPQAPLKILLHNVGVTLLDGKRKVAAGFGEALLENTSLGGAVPVDLSYQALDLADPVISLDFKPALDPAQLDARLRRDLEKDGRAPLQNVLNGLLPQAIIPLFVSRLQLDPRQRCAEVGKVTRTALGKLCKDLRFAVTGNRGWDEALVTAGGVVLDEVDPRTMASRVCPGLYLCGEVLDVDGVTGGYNLQAAFSTGFVAGEAAAERAR